ncbi:MAG TPA: CHRD domain-containing protein [Vicinamibacterales bacterium]|nr:CHRD domain-containing protein [Vicinamibacterales bacterium]
MPRLVLFALAVAVAAGCSSDSVRTPVQPESISLPLVVAPAPRVVDPARHAGTRHNYSVHLSGDEEPTPVPPAPSPQDSRAQGEAIFKIAEDGLSLDYKLIAANIDNVVQAHIHCGPRGMNGGIFIWLFPSVTSTTALTGPTGRHDGVVAEGTVVSGAALNVRTVASSAICPGGVANFADALRQIRSGNAYVNIHTNDGVGATNTGPGDFPGGEVRGQLEDHGAHDE